MNKRLKGQIISIFGAQYRFAKAVGDSPVVVSEVIHNRRQISAEKKLRWSLILRTSVDIFDNRDSAVS